MKKLNKNAFILKSSMAQTGLGKDMIFLMKGKAPDTRK